MKGVCKKGLLLALFSVGIFLTLQVRSAAAATTYYWVGTAGGNTSAKANWNTAAAACSGTGNASAAPVAGDTVNFVSNCTNNATIDASLSVANFTIATGYSGEITQAADLTVSSTYSQSAGTFTGDTHTLTLGNFTHTAGGTFTAPTNTVFSGATCTFNVATTENLNNVTVSLNNVNTLVVSSGDTMVVLGTLTLTDGILGTGTIDARGDINQAATFDGGDAYLDFGNNGLNQIYTIAGGAGPMLRFDNSADASDSVVFSTANVTLTGLYITAGFGNGNTVPFTYNGHDLTIGNYNSALGLFSQASGTFNAPTNMTFSGINNTVFTKTGGTYNEGTNTIFANMANSNCTYDVATTETFNNVTVNTTTSGNVLTIATGDTMVVTGNLTLTNGSLNGGTVDARGNVVASTTFDGGTTTIDFGDNGVAQTYTIDNSAVSPGVRFNSGDSTDSIILNVDASLNSLTIDADFGANPILIIYNSHALSTCSYSQGAGTFTAPASFAVGGNFTKTGGTFDEGTGTVTFGMAQTGDTTFNVGTSETFYNVVINKPNYFGEHVVVITSGQTMVVTGDLTLTRGYLYTGTVDVRGNITQAANFLGTSATIDFGNDSVAQTYTINGGVAPWIRFNSAADMSDSVVVTADATITGLTFTYATPGVEIPVNLNGKTVTIYNLTMVDGIFTPPSDKVLTLGHFTFSGGVFNAPANIIMCGNYTGSAGSTFNEGTGTITFKTNAFSDTTINTDETFYNVVVDKENYFGGHSVTVATGKTMTIAGNLTLTTGYLLGANVAVIGNLTVNSTFTLGQATIIFSGSNVQSFNLTGATGFLDGDITVNKTSGQVNLLSALVMDAANQDLLIQQGVFDLNGQNLTVNGSNGTFVVSSGGIFQLQGGESVTTNPAYAQFAAGATAKYDGVAGPYTIKKYAYSNLIIDGAGSTFSLPAAIVVNDLAVNNGTLDATAGNYNISLFGNLTVSGTLNNRSNTVYFRGQNQTITGNVTFNNFEKTKSSNLPSDLGASLWLDASDNNFLVLNGSLITQWIDKTGHSRNGTPGNSGTEPSQNVGALNSKNTISFASTKGINVAYNLSASPYTLYVVYNTTGSSAGRRAIQGSSNNWLIGPYSGNQKMYGGTGFVGTGPSVNPGTFVIAGTTNNGSAASFYVDGTNYATSPSNVGAPGLMCLGGYSGAGVCGAFSEPLQGDIAEVIVYPSALGTSDRVNLECYLSSKWGISTANSCTGLSNSLNQGDVTLTFAAGSTTTVNGALTLNGVDASNRVNLISSTPGTHWNLNVQGTQSISWVDVMDSDASSGNLMAYTNAVNSGNNHNWGFDETNPTITNVSSDKANGTYGPGEVIDIDLTFSENITTTGDITVTLDTGGTCVFNGVTNAGTASCNYTVQAGQNSSDLTVASISGTIKDQSLNQMSDFTPLTNLAANKALVIDTTPPTITNVTSSKDNGRYKAGEVIPIDVTFSEPVTSASVTVTLDTTRTCNFSITNSTTGSCNYTVQAGDTSADLNTTNISGTITDQYTNTLINFTPATNLATNKALVIDTTAPTIQSVSSDKTNGTYGTSAIIDIDVTFSEAVTSTGSVTVTLDTGRTCTFTVSNSSTASCNYTVQAGDGSSDLNTTGITGTIADQAGNSMASFTPATNLAANKALVIDTNPPVINNISSDKANGRYKVGEIIDIDLTFSEAVTTTGSATVTLDTGRTCTFSVSNSTTATCDYTVQAGDNSNDLNASSVSGTILDTDGNPMASFTPLTNLAANKAIIIDTTAPTITSVSSNTANGIQGLGTVIDINVYFSEAVTSTGSVTVTLDTGRTCTFTVASSSSASCNYTVQTGDVSADLNTSSITGTIADLVGNSMTSFAPATNLATNKNLVIDGAGPTITNITSSKTNGRYKQGEVISIDLTFSKAVTGTGTITLETGATDRTCNFSVTNSSSASCDYTVQAGDTTADLNVNSVTGTIADQFANPMTDFTPTTNLSTNKDIIIDTTAPLLSSHTPNDNETGIPLTTNLVLNFSEIVNKGTGNIYIKKSADNTTLETIDVASAQVTGQGTTTITIDPSVTYPELTSLYIEIPSTVFVDRAGNQYAGINDSTTWNFSTTDVTSPTILSASSTKTNGTYTLGTVIDIVLTFSEKVTGSGTITLETGATDRTCNFTVVDSLTASCNYTVQLNDTSTDLTVKEITGTVADQFENPLVNFTPAQNLAFNKNFVIDTTAPTVLTLTPLNGTTGIVADDPYTIKFSEPIYFGTGNITLKRTNDNATIETIDVNGPKVSGSGTDTVVITHAVALTDTTAYYLQIGDVAFQDLAGNHYSGITNNSDWHYTTRTTNAAPVVSTPNNIQESTDGEGYVTFKLDVSDADLQTTELNLKYSTNQTDWYNLTVKAVSLSNGTADINNDNQRQINSIDTNLGKQTLTVTWDAKKDLGITELDSVYLKATAHDGNVDGASAISEGFGYDSRSPETGNLQVTSITEDTISLSWSTPKTERNFKEYKVCFASTLTKAESCQSEWNKNNDSALGSKDTNKTKLTGLTNNTSYYFALVATDTFGNESMITSDKATTLKPIILCINDCIETVTPPVDDNNDQGGDNNNQGGGDNGGDEGPHDNNGGGTISTPTPRPKASPKPTPKVETNPTPAPSEAPIVKTTKQTIGTIAALPEIYFNTLKGVFGVIMQDKNLQTLNSVTVALGVVALVTTLSVVSSVISILESLPYLFQYLFNFFASIFSLGKKRRNWGRVINFYTGLPVPGTLVLIIDAASGKVKAQEYTDKGGYFASFLPAGNYLFQIAKQGYVLTNEVSAFVTNKSEQVYQGQPIKVEKEAVLALVLALKPVTAIPSRFVRFLLRAIDLLETFFNAISWPLLLLGFTVNTTVFFTTHSPVSVVFFFIYLVIAIIKIVIIQRFKHTLGLVTDKATSEGIGLAIIRLYDAQTNRLLTTKATTDTGKFMLLTAPGKYNLTVSKEGYLPYQANQLIIKSTTRALAFEVGMRRG